MLQEEAVILLIVGRDERVVELCKPLILWSHGNEMGQCSWDQNNLSDHESVSESVSESEIHCDHENESVSDHEIHCDHEIHHEIHCDHDY